MDCVTVSGRARSSDCNINVTSVRNPQSWADGRKTSTDRSGACSGDILPIPAAPTWNNTQWGSPPFANILDISKRLPHKGPKYWKKQSKSKYRKLQSNKLQPIDQICSIACVFINKVLLGYSHIHTYWSRLLCAQKGRVDQLHKPRAPKPWNILLQILIKSSADPHLNYQ